RGPGGGLVVFHALADQVGEVDAAGLCLEPSGLGAGEQEHVIDDGERLADRAAQALDPLALACREFAPHPALEARGGAVGGAQGRSEEHTSELPSRENLVCRLLLEKKNG